jgi:hypothetical protein
VIISKNRGADRFLYIFGGFDDELLKHLIERPEFAQLYRASLDSEESTPNLEGSKF